MYDFLQKIKPTRNSILWAKFQIKFKSADLKKFKEILTILVFMEIH